MTSDEEDSRPRLQRGQLVARETVGPLATKMFFQLATWIQWLA